MAAAQQMLQQLSPEQMHHWPLQGTVGNQHMQNAMQTCSAQQHPCSSASSFWLGICCYIRCLDVLSEYAADAPPCPCKSFRPAEKALVPSRASCLGTVVPASQPAPTAQALLWLRLTCQNVWISNTHTAETSRHVKSATMTQPEHSPLPRAAGSACIDAAGQANVQALQLSLH